MCAVPHDPAPGTRPGAVNHLHLLLRTVLQSDLPMARRMIMVVMLNHADGSGKAWPSQQHIAKQSGLGERAVRDHLHALEAAGWISIIGHIGRNNIYRVSHPANFADSKPQNLRDDRQNLRDNENDNPQNLRDKPADSSSQPADFAVQTGTFCRLTSHELPNKYPLTSHKETGRPSPGEEVDKLKQRAKAETHARPQPPKPKPDWREWNRQQCEAANSVATAPTMPPDFHAAWQGWQTYRTRRATEARIASEAVPWTQYAAEAGLRECERAANTHGWRAVIARIDQAISGGWQGLNTDKIIPTRQQQHPAHAEHRPQRSDSANRPGRYATPGVSGPGRPICMG